jgi:hypothetical protein
VLAEHPTTDSFSQTLIVLDPSGQGSHSRVAAIRPFVEIMPNVWILSILLAGPGIPVSVIGVE